MIILLIVAGMAGLAIRSIRKSKKAGSTCGCGCEGCAQSCGKKNTSEVMQ